MECNKDDALKAKELAEKKMLEMDLGGARKFALKAQNLYPKLDGLPQLLATIEVHVSAERRIDGEVDWYKVMGVDPLADEDTIRRSYRRLALALHPDKNKSAGAEGAFKLISQGWTLLSNKAERILYDQNRNSKAVYEETPYVKPFVPASQSHSSNLFNTSNKKEREFETLKQSFWTICRHCRTEFEYHIVYHNRHLICRECYKTFIAFETPSPSFYKDDSLNSGSAHMQCDDEAMLNRMQRIFNVSGRMMETPTMNSSETVNGSGAFNVPTSISGAQSSTSFASKASSDFKVPSERLKAEQEVAAPHIADSGKSHVDKATSVGSTFQSSSSGPNSGLKMERPRKKRHIDDGRVDRDKRETESVKSCVKEGTSLGDKYGSEKGSFESGRVNGVGNYKRKETRVKDTLNQQIKKMLMEKALKEIRTKLEEWRISSASRNLAESSSKACKEVKERDKESSKSGGEKIQQVDDSDTKLEKKSSTTDADIADADIAASEATDSMCMSVPDPDFHDFDSDRTEEAFGPNQVWAVYDDDDGMPRYYVLIHDVISVKPLKMKISWLNSKSNDELEPIAWVSCGFPKTCGDFRTGKHEFFASLNSFSHRVNWKKGARGVVHVYPKKDQVWALYRNWSPDWDEMTPDETIHEYDMVYVLEDYNEEQGVNVAPLVKVAGFKTVFLVHATKNMNIPRREMFRLSHQVPSCPTTDQAPNAPIGCLELDPAATPADLLKVILESPKREMTFEEKVAQIAKRDFGSPENLIVYQRKRYKGKH
ncbi:meiotically up-regulated gene 184 protein-like [Senna tora]|uniref:Meiotically up-regulated gene 184 protein-like n=1 Tax=Senna tora TaxID=362788 RepID=A0A835CBJ5_9FABA|nr:meiotically up-regulated gene 184 protein-like [Senna tora]